MTSLLQGNNFNYKVIPSGSTTATVCGEGGFISTYTVVPLSSAATTTTLFDGTTAVFITPVHTGIAGSRPYTLQLNIFSESTAGFKVSTGSSVSVVISGNFGRGASGVDNV
jgi:hypothetical protein